MASTRRRPLGKIIRPVVVIVLMLILAWLFQGSVLMTAALVIGLIALAFLVIELFTRLPGGHDHK